MSTRINLLTLALLLAATTSISQLHTQDEYFQATFDNKYLLTIIYDSKKSQFAKKLIDRLLNDLVIVDFIKDRQIALASTDMAEITMLREHYTIKGNFGFFFYINNQLQRFEDFNDLADDFLNQKLLYADLIEESTKFLRDRIGRVNAPLRSVDDFNAAVGKHKIIGVYLGKLSGFFYDQYADFASKHIDFNFYHAANNHVADQIYQLTKKVPRPQDQDLFAIVRHPVLIDEIDTQHLVSIDAHRLLEDYRAFFEYERFPKLRDENHGDDIFFRLYNHNQKLVLYVYNNETSMEDLNQFKKAVYLMPRIFMFAHVNSASAKFGSFMQMFIHAGQNPTDNRVYIFHTAAGKLFVQSIPTDVVAEKIVEGVGRYFQHHRGLFSTGERSMVGDIDGARTDSDEEKIRVDDGQSTEDEGPIDGDLVYSEL